MFHISPQYQRYSIEKIFELVNYPCLDVKILGFLTENKNIKPYSVSKLKVNKANLNKSGLDEIFFRTVQDPN